MEIKKNGKGLSDNPLQEACMVTIEPNKGIPPIVDPKTESEKATPADGGFETIFKQAIKSEEPRSYSAEPPLAASDIRPARFSTQTAGNAGVSVVGRTEQLMATLEAYREKLDENGATMKDVEPLVQQMASQSEALVSTSQSEPGAGDKLQGIVDQALMLSSMEIARYTSGHYNEG
jgi:hypothetical protein